MNTVPLKGLPPRYAVFPTPDGKAYLLGYLPEGKIKVNEVWCFEGIVPPTLEQCLEKISDWSA